MSIRCCINTTLIAKFVITPRARRAWRSYKFASLDFSVFFFGYIVMFAHECSVLLSEYEIRTGIKERDIRALSITVTFYGSFLFGVEKWADNAGTKLHEPIETRRLTAEYVNKTCILTCILQYLNRKKVLRAKILMQNVL